MNARSSVVTRFAPSPTGYLHIGGARTALFNWLFARHLGGAYRLRIEDTDRARSTQDAIDAIMQGLEWLGLGHDGDVVFQFARAARHAEVAHQLLARGHAYYCYASAEELDAMREAQRAEGKPIRYDGRWRDRSANDTRPNAPPVIRIKAPQTGETVVRDHVQGDVRFRNDVLDDMVLLRSDGTPTYMLAVVVDDFDMGVTHVIRGDDHLTNAARQLQIIQAMDWPVPEYAHLPMMHGDDGAKLSKRHGALGIHEYENLGYLPEAMRNYLLRMGWSHGDDEIISTDQAIQWFNLDSIGQSPARMDFKKLENLNGHYIREAPDKRLAGEVIKILSKRGMAASGDVTTKLVRAMPGLKERAKTLTELADATYYLTASRPLELDEKAQKLITPESQGMLRSVRDVLAQSEWTAAKLEEAVKAFAQAQGWKLGTLAQPLRAALTARVTSPGIFDVLEVLGRDEALARVSDILV